VRSAVALNARRADPRRDEDTRSLAEKMFGDVTKVFSFGKEEEEKVVVEQGPLDASRAISEIDRRAASGEVTYQDFIAMSRTFAELNGEVPGMPKLSPSEVAETKRKFEKHERIVQAMSQEELKDPQLMVDDIDSINNGETKGPRVQRLALESGVTEKDVLLFVAEFEAMRESTSRIAAGEDPDKVNASLGDGKGNRSQRRAIAKAQKKAAKKGSML
jgi:signal recognition particle GTPase